jgi:molecular chaperone DnaK (HSP70)
VNGPAVTPKHALMCDLGGGTFDTTVIRLAGDDVTVVCVEGDPRLGGADWDRAIADRLLGQFEREHLGLHPGEDPQFTQDLLLAAERLKKELGAARSRRHVIRFGGRTTVVELTRTAVEELTAGLLARMTAVIDKTVETARAKGVTSFDEVLLVGGMSRFPAVADVLRERFGVRPLRHEPDLAVAKGAALYARVLGARSAGPARSVPGPAPAPSSGSAAGPAAAASVPAVGRLAAARVAGVVPRAFGVLGVDGSDPLALTDPARARKMVVHLLLANTELPADTGPYTFMTAIENQRMVEIEVWEQVSQDLSDDLAANRKVGRGLLRNLPAHLPAMSPVEITFVMSETGRLTVHGREARSGQEVHFELQIGDLDSGKLREARQAVSGYRVDG